MRGPTTGPEQRLGRGLSADRHSLSRREVAPQLPQRRHSHGCLLSRGVLRQAWWGALGQPGAAKGKTQPQAGREDGRQDHTCLSRCCRRRGAAFQARDRRVARMAAYGGCIRMYACSSLNLKPQHALLERMILS